MATRKDLFTETITETKNLGEVQNQSEIAMYGKRMGLAVIEVDVKALMVQEGVDALLAGTYYIKVPNVVADANNSTLANMAIPDNAIYHEIIVDTHEAKAGSGTIVLSLGATALTAIDAVGITDDSAKKGTVKLAAADTIKIVVASGTVTAGAFTVFARFFLGN